MFTDILMPAVILGGVGLIFGVVIGIVNKYFKTEEDGRVIMVREALPGANCGACGFPGCDGLAKAIAGGTAPVNSCPVCNNDAIQKIASIMGVETDSIVPLAAFVNCRGSFTNTYMKFTYEGIEDCAAADVLAEGYKSCKFSCLGFGNCARVCPTNAININAGLAEVDRSKCIACGKCVAACPRGIIHLLPAAAAVKVACHSTLTGSNVRERCDAGCIGCGICAKKCKFDAITMVNNIPVVDYEKCVGCLQCAKACPRNCITIDQHEQPKTAYIKEDACIGCTRCARVCKFDAISGDVKKPHVVDSKKCVGCGQCETKCPKDAIIMIRK